MFKIKNIILFVFILVLTSSGVKAALPTFPEDEGIYIIDKTTDTVIYEQNQDIKFSPASITKLLTALILVENIPDLNQVVTVGNEVNDFTYEDSRAMIWEGQQLTYNDLLNAMLIPSGNDAAQSIAVNVGKVLANTTDRTTAENAFIDAMNKKAEELGMANSHFVNPHGRTDPNHYTTAKDYALLAEEAFSHEEIKKAASTKSYTLKNQDGTDNILNSSDFCLYVNSGEMNGSSYLQSIFPNLLPGQIVANPYYSPYLTAAKTGRTDPGERTYTFYSNQDNNDVYGVILNSKSSMGIFQESKAIVDTLSTDYKNIDLNNILDNSVEIEDTSIISPNELTYNLNEANLYDVENGEKLNTTYRFDDDYIINEDGKYKLINTVYENDKVGSLLITNSNGVTKTIPIYASQNYYSKNFLDLLVDNIVFVGIGVLLIIGIIILFYVRNKKKKDAGFKF